MLYGKCVVYLRLEKYWLDVNNVIKIYFLLKLIISFLQNLNCNFGRDWLVLSHTVKFKIVIDKFKIVILVEIGWSIFIIINWKRLKI
jgi:hypothetical protein